jgi:para-nitrobenzyl esterase
MSGLPRCQPDRRVQPYPIMGGNVEDEGNFGIGIKEYFSGPPMMPVTAADYTSYVTNTYSAPAYPGGNRRQGPGRVPADELRHATTGRR